MGDLLTYGVDHFFAGAWDLVWHWGVGIGLIILLGLGAWFSPVYKKDFIYAAFIVGVALLFEGVGVRDEAARCSAQQRVVTKYVTKEVSEAKKSHNPDPYDSPDN